jgi:hypothetical protein
VRPDQPVLQEEARIEVKRALRQYTTRSAEMRARELSRTGVPGKWQVAHEISTGSPKQVEKTIHQKLSCQKVRDGGEFFKVSPEKAARVVKSVAQS